MKPKADEIEVTIFGTGYVECIVIHVGSGKWVIIDSCLDDANKPASLSYLQSLGVSVETNVIAVSASHWHDDHIKGLAKTIILKRVKPQSFPSARLWDYRSSLLFCMITRCNQYRSLTGEERSFSTV